MRKLLIGLLIICCCDNAYALAWEDLWWRKDEQGKKLMAQDKFNEAAQRFENPNWRGVAHYRSGHYYKAVKDFAENDSAPGHYNRGNALAHMGYYQDAINAYEKALQHQADYADAKHNLEVVKKLLKRKQQQQPNYQASNKNKKSPQQQAGAQPSNSDQSADKSNRPAQQKPQQQVGQQKKPQDQQQAGQPRNKPDPQKHADNKQQPSEQDQSHKQWLRRIPDDPGGLLKNKFYREHLKRRRAQVQ